MGTGECVDYAAHVAVSSSCSLVGYIRPSGELHHVLNESICVLCSVAQLLHRCTLRCNGQSRHRPVVPSRGGKNLGSGRRNFRHADKNVLVASYSCKGWQNSEKNRRTGLDTQNGSGSFALLISHNHLQHDPKASTRAPAEVSRKIEAGTACSPSIYVVGTEFDVCFFRVPRAEQQHRIDHLLLVYVVDSRT